MGASAPKINITPIFETCALSDLQALLDAEAKLGEMLAAIPAVRDKEGSSQGTSLPSLPQGITKKESHFAQQIQTHPEIVETTKARAREEALRVV